jgi:hypothetical protein
MHKLCVRGLVAIGAVAALSGQASTTGMTLHERVDVADFIGVVRIQSVHRSPDATQPVEQRQDWFRQTAEAEVTETIKGVNIPTHITIGFDNSQGQAPPNVQYDRDAKYLVFLSREINGGFSTCVQGQYAIHEAAIDGWPGSAGPVALGVARSAIASILPR